MCTSSSLRTVLPFGRVVAKGAIVAQVVASAAMTIIPGYSVMGGASIREIEWR